MSNGKKMIALVLATFIALIVVGGSYSGHHGDPTGSTTGTSADVIASQALQGTGSLFPRSGSTPWPTRPATSASRSTSPGC